MNKLIDTDFNDPQSVTLSFIQAAFNFNKSCPIGPKGDTKECVTAALEIMHYYTYLKFHPYCDHRSGLNNIKDIKEIDFVEKVNKNIIHIHTKKNHTAAPACLFTLKFKDRKWRVSEVHIKRSNNKNLYHSLFKETIMKIYANQQTKLI